MTFFACTFVTVLVALIFITFVFYTAYPVLKSEGLSFITGKTWSYSDNVYGVRLFLAGTLVMTGLTLVLAVPLSIFTAIFLSEFAPRSVASTMRPMIELLVGIPSVVYGIFGLFVLAPIFRDHLNPLISGALGFIPFFYDSSPQLGIGLLLASTILTVMILPTITAFSEDAISSVPNDYKEASYALGATHWETISKVILPAASAGIIAAVILGMMRAMGETMAIVMLLGNSFNIPSSIFDTGYAMTSKILNDAGFYIEQATPRSALFGIAAVLFTMEMVFVAIARKLGGRI